MSVSLGVAAQPPLEAWREDSTRPGVSATAEAAAAWILVASTLWRVGQLPSVDRPPALAEAARVLRRIAAAPRPVEADHPQGDAPVGSWGPDEVPAADRTLVNAVAECVGVVAAIAEPPRDTERKRDAWQALASAVQDAASALERTGAFALADSLLAATVMLLPSCTEPVAGRLWAQRGRVARQVGNHVAAQTLYDSADRVGRRHRDLDLRSRATLGLGATAMARGNYPEARAFFQRVIRWSQPEALRHHRSAAHQGLFAAALAADDWNTALRHGWLAFQIADSGPDRQAELVGMLAQLALRVGDSQAALQAYRVSCSLTLDVRLRLIAYGGIVSAAAQSGHVTVLDEAQREAAALIARSAHTYENAFVMYELAAANAQLGRSSQAARFAAAAERSARDHGLYEILHRVEALVVALTRAPSAGAPASAPSQRSVARVDDTSSLTSARDDLGPQQGDGKPSVYAAASTGVALNAPARRVLRSLHALRPSEQEAEVVSAC